MERVKEGSDIILSDKDTLNKMYWDMDAEVYTGGFELWYQKGYGTGLGEMIQIVEKYGTCDEMREMVRLLNEVQEVVNKIIGNVREGKEEEVRTLYHILDGLSEQYRRSAFEYREAVRRTVKTM